jgi:hypothetical protein
VLDDEHPDGGVVDQPVPERKSRRFIPPRIALLLNSELPEMPELGVAAHYFQGAYRGRESGGTMLFAR